LVYYRRWQISAAHRHSLNRFFFNENCATTHFLAMRYTEILLIRFYDK
jgi:hypothetical protein